MADTIEFTELAGQPCALADLGSAYEFLQPETIQYLLQGDDDLSSYLFVTQQKGREVAAEFFRQVLNNARKKRAPALRLLEHLVVNEFLVIDQLLVEKRVRSPMISKSLSSLLDSPWFRTCLLPKEVRNEAANEIIKNRALTRQINKQVNPGFCSGDKEAHDDWAAVYHTYCFADSNDDAERAFFYLSVGAQAQVPLVVSETKRDQIITITGHSELGPHALITNYASAGGLDGDSQRRLFAQFDPLSVPLPPIQEMILWNAYREGVSPMDAFKTIRGSAQAVAYRNLLHALGQSLRGGFKERNQAESKLAAIATLINEWKKNPPTGQWLTHTRINIQHVPVIGWLAEMVGKFDNLAVPDLFLRRRDAATVFMSEWFTEKD